MKLLLNKGYIAYVDDDDPKEPWKFHWWAREDKRKDGTIRNVYVARWVGNSRTNRKLIHLHRFLLGVASRHIEVDHKDGDGLNNRRCNLQRTTKSQNLHGYRNQTNNTSGCIGVYWDKESRKWRVKITLQGKTIHGNRHQRYEDAVKERKTMHRLIFERVY